MDIGERNLAAYAYTDDGNNYLSSLDYGNGDKVQYKYDKQGRVIKQTYEDGDAVTYQYDNSGALATVTDSATGRKTTYYYDFTDRLMKYVETGTDYYHSVGYEYDTLNNLTTLVETVNGAEYTTSYTYDDDNRVKTVTTNGTTVEYTYDGYGRISTQVTKRGDVTILTETYTYVNPTSTTTSSQIATYKTETANYSITYSYTYDDNGNILTVHNGTYLTSYEYDSANQLIRENNQWRNRSYTWTYDSAGNVVSEKTYAYTTGEITDETATVSTNGYTYGDEDWGDLLTAHNGSTISYDAIGNPLSDANRSFTWEHGRQMATQTRGDTTWTYTYDANGMRTSRSNGTKTYKYVYSGDKLVQMTVTDTSANTEQLIEFTYDAVGQPLTMTLDGTVYYYLLNIQGDVMGLVDGDGNLLVSYLYEAYGECFYITDTSDMVNTLIGANPLLYRSYLIDTGTGLYYLQSRYYDPQLGRFLNADGLVSTGQGLLGYNMFAYCGNNPAMFIDSSGMARIPCTVISDGDRNRPEESDNEETDFETNPYSLCCQVVLPLNLVVTVTPEIAQVLSGMMGTYSDLRKISAGTGMQVHHLVDQRFYVVPGFEQFKANPSNTPCVILPPQQHQYYTKATRNVIPYGSNYSSMNSTYVLSTLEGIYGGKSDFWDYICSFFK